MVVLVTFAVPDFSSLYTLGRQKHPKSGCPCKGSKYRLGLNLAYNGAVKYVYTKPHGCSSHRRYDRPFIRQKSGARAGSTIHVHTTLAICLTGRMLEGQTMNVAYRQGSTRTPRLVSSAAAELSPLTF